MRIEDPAIFEAAHAVTFRLYGEGLIDGVRVDHIDGLSDPAAYARALHGRLEILNAGRPADAPGDGPWIVVEKILGADEAMPTDWSVDGTTGYDFMDQVSALQHAEAGRKALGLMWREQSGGADVFDHAEITARTEILQTAFAGQLSRAAQGFADLALQDPSSRDLTLESFRRAITALVARVRVYRTYATGRAAGPAPGAAFDDALETAAQDLRAEPTLRFIRDVLVGRGPGTDEARADVVRRLNQLTAPVAAKAVEDTAFYRYGRLLSRNDVGFAPSRFSLSVADFVASGQARAADWPRAMLATATHDHKRGEDMRARLAVISELSGAWAEAVETWSRINAPKRPSLMEGDDDYHLYQTLVGAWPIGLTVDDAAGLTAFYDRVAAWREKSLREAKLRTSWAAPDEAFEAASQAWLQTLLSPQASPDFLRSLAAFGARIAGAGAINGVVQAALRCAWPGVPDLYQGAELWDLSLVDPDNRRPVDFDARARLLADGASDWRSGAAKLSVIAALLESRRRDSSLFLRGALKPLPVNGARAAHVLAFSRSLDDRRIDIAVMLHVAEAVHEMGKLPPTDWWDDTEVAIDGHWRRAADLFTTSPVATFAPSS